MLVPKACTAFAGLPMGTESEEGPESTNREDGLTNMEPQSLGEDSLQTTILLKRPVSSVMLLWWRVLQACERPQNHTQSHKCRQKS